MISHQTKPRCEDCGSILLRKGVACSCCNADTRYDAAIRQIQNTDKQNLRIDEPNKVNFLYPPSAN